MNDDITLQVDFRRGDILRFKKLPGSRLRVGYWQAVGGYSDAGEPVADVSYRCQLLTTQHKIIVGEVDVFANEVTLVKRAPKGKS